MAIIGDRFFGFIGELPPLEIVLPYQTARTGRQRASYERVVEAIFHGQLAGGTTPFILRYSTICP